jgi:hypothetical protein
MCFILRFYLTISKYMKQLKYTKNIDFFIVNILPYLEIYFNENQNDTLTIYANEQICEILSHMFGIRVIVQKTKSNTSINHSDIYELDFYLSSFYDISRTINISRPLTTDSHHFLKSKKYICIFPKFKPNDTYHNISELHLKYLLENTPLKQYEIFIIGHQFDRLNTKIGKDLDNFNDTLVYLKYCKLFITSESNWHYIGLLCNSRNNIVFSSTYDEAEKENKLINYNPFNNNIYITNDLMSEKVCTLIKNIL